MGECVAHLLDSPLFFCMCPLQCICGSTTTRLIVPCAHQVNQRTTLVNHMERCLHRAFPPDLLRSLLESTHRTFTVQPFSCSPRNLCFCDITSTTQYTCALWRALTTWVIACTARSFSARCALCFLAIPIFILLRLQLLTKVATLAVRARTPLRFTEKRFMVAPA